LRASHNAGFCVAAFGDYANAKGPSLLVREAPGGGVAALAWSEWSREGPAAGSMAALARIVHREQPYLLGGSR
jgi:hypothetical protein